MGKDKLGAKLKCRILQLQKRTACASRRLLCGTDFLGRVADIIRSCLGPKAMLKMLLDPMGGIVLTNDGHAILREIEVGQPAAKAMLEMCRTQDEATGDGTAGVIVLAGEILARMAPLLLDRKIHPVQLIAGLKHGLSIASKR